jgi:hypothetical protein
VRSARKKVAAPRGDALPVGQQLAGVFEEDDTIAEQAPPLLGVGGNGMGSFTVNLIGRGAAWIVGAQVSRTNRLEGSNHHFFPGSVYSHNNSNPRLLVAPRIVSPFGSQANSDLKSGAP